MKNPIPQGQVWSYQKQMLGSPIYDGHIRVICVDYLLLSCMPVYMLLYVCYIHMIPSLYDGHIRVIYVDYLLLSCIICLLYAYDSVIS